MDDWETNGVRFPAGTEFRASHKGRSYFGRVEAGALVVDGKSYRAPSTAADAITGTSVNGWVFWECKLPEESVWQLIDELRTLKSSRLVAA